MQVQCPNCSKQMEVPGDLLGKNIFCTSCGSRIQAVGLKSAAPVPPPSPATGEGPTKKCPYCAETILKAARKCRYCKQDLPDGVDSEAVRDRLRMKDKKAADQNLAAASLSQPAPKFGRFRTLTKVMAGLCALFLVLGVASIIIVSHIEKEEKEANLRNQQTVDLSQLMTERTNAAPYRVLSQPNSLINHKEDWLTVAVLSFMMLLIFGLILLVVFIVDLSVPASDKRTTPALGLKAFLSALRLGRYGYGYYCLLDGDKDGLTRSRQAIEPVKVYGGDFGFSGLEGFKQYWKGICRPGEGQSRRMVVTNVRTEKSAGDYAQVSGRVRIESYPSAVVWTVLISPLLAIILVLAMTKRQELTLTKLMRKVGSQWFVVNGELSSVEDNAWEAVAGRN